MLLALSSFSSMLAFALSCFALVRETQTHVLGATCNSCSEFPCPPFLVSKQIVETKTCHTMFTAVVASPLLRLPSTQSCLCLVPFFFPHVSVVLFSFFSIHVVPCSLHGVKARKKSCLVRLTEVERESEECLKE